MYGCMSSFSSVPSTDTFLMDPGYSLGSGAPAKSMVLLLRVGLSFFVLSATRLSSKSKKRLCLLRKKVGMSLLLLFFVWN